MYAAPENTPNVERIRAWARALETGEFEQTKQRLYRGPLGSEEYGNRAERAGYCCLGVACVVAEEAGLEIDGDWRQLRILPPEVWDWFGLPSYNPSLHGIPATTWNDAYNTNFHGIANLVRAEYLKDDDGTE
jgi:hypothetical protein